MNDTIVVAIVSGLCVAIPSLIATFVTNAKNNALQDERIASIKTNIAELTDKVEKHNNFGIQLAKLETRIDILERSMKQ